MKIDLMRNTAAALALVFGAAGGAAAQPADPGQGAYQEPAGIGPVSDAEIRSFVQAAANVTDVVETYRPQLQAAESEDAAMAIQTEAQDEMEQAITEAGMEMDRYNDIMAAARRDVELSQRIAAEVERADQQGPQN